MEQYLHTIHPDSPIQPSYIIRKFLDAQKINNLTLYLARLHEKGKPTKDHTTLLLNCYTKLKDSHKLDEFITPRTDSSDQKQPPNFDVDTAIRVCREAGLLEHARRLAKQNERHEIFIELLLEEGSLGDLQKYQEALFYIQKLDFLNAEKNMKRFGKTLIEKEPKGATEILKQLCSGFFQQQSGKTKQQNDLLIQIQFLLVYVMSKSLRNLFYNSSTVDKRKRIQATPDSFIHLFVRKQKELKEFLEYLTNEQPNSCNNTVYNTLLEIYMKDAVTRLKANLSDQQREEVESAERKIMQLLGSEENKYDMTHALALGKMYRIEQAVLYLYTKMNLFHEVVQHYQEKEDYDNVIAACRQFSNSDPSLWTHAFIYFIKSSNSKKCDREIKICLDQISKSNLLPPLMIIELLSETEVSIDVIREYIINDLHQQQLQIEQDEKEIEQHKKDITKMERQIEELSTKAKTFQGTKCAECNMQLELPTIHFLCGHSFHSRCLHTKEVKCPKCADDHEEIFSKQRGMEKSKGDHDGFFAQLKQAHGQGDAFGKVAEYFGRGVIY
ncbi:RING zinc finger-containing protein [Reticulomyxa filosa]|uniref:RING zinc finger-containing protein n=1 Tax=Reticulomyxa filosa TaxID=46433 RepID=X6M2L0_RETFI|nr:RING zinc finger-containing protein [Reticulomyxa filosa]|eukprot:ETO07662.1 RING zinc finger-containing protein [Reticulomyxa filosa]